MHVLSKLILVGLIILHSSFTCCIINSLCLARSMCRPRQGLGVNAMPLFCGSSYGVSPRLCQWCQIIIITIIITIIINIYIIEIFCVQGILLSTSYTILFNPLSRGRFVLSHLWMGKKVSEEGSNGAQVIGLVKIPIAGAMQRLLSWVSSNSWSSDGSHPFPGDVWSSELALEDIWHVRKSIDVLVRQISVLTPAESPIN